MLITVSFLLPAPPAVSDASLVSHRQMFPETARKAPPQSFADVWLVEETDKEDVFSNGLRVDNRFSTPNQPRFYQVLDRKHGMTPSGDWHSQPVGIVYHTTESAIAPFDAQRNDALKRISKVTLDGLRDNRSYNFFIDRFGRVLRIVEETSAANHAGNSIWADETSAYLNLNSSFLGVAFEAQTGTDDFEPRINAAQVHAGRILTEMLRAKYKISSQNCVTHAQVSVNPSNMRIGYHTDWARGFPFAALGLDNNYNLPPASLSDFGFEYDGLFRRAIGPDFWKGIPLAEAQMAQDAAGKGSTYYAHKAALQDRYHRLYSALKLTGALEESNDATAKTSE
ncbi:MAG: peptidoglycan recognition family protein [Bryobacteraceae bacterium]